MAAFEVPVLVRTDLWQPHKKIEQRRLPSAATIRYTRKILESPDTSTQRRVDLLLQYAVSWPRLLEEVALDRIA